jgi:hypothetical protein
MPYQPGDITGLEESRLSLALWGAQDSIWSLNQTSTVDTASRKVQALVNHFSQYRILENSWVLVSSSQSAEISLVDGTKAVIKPATFSENKYIYLGALAQGEYSTSVADPKYRLLNIARRFSALNTVQYAAASAKPQNEQSSYIKSCTNSSSYNEQINITVPYSAGDVSGVNPTRLRLMWFDASLLKWKIVNTSQNDASNSCIKAWVSRFSDYAIAEFSPLGELLEKDKVYTYPNPAKGDTLYFKYYSGDDTFVYIDIYNVAGEKIAHLYGEGAAGLVSEIPWSINKYASGIYVYIVEAKAKYGDAKKKIVKKLAIIH